MTTVYRTWHEVMEAARAGEPLYYQAPMDRNPTRFTAGKGAGKVAPWTYKVMPRGIRLTPLKSTADPFTATADHLERFVRVQGRHFVPVPATEKEAGESAYEKGDYPRALKKAKEIAFKFSRPGYRAMVRELPSWVDVFVDSVYESNVQHAATVNVYPAPPGKEPVVRVLGPYARNVEQIMAGK